MRVLVACEFSGIVRDAFAARGHDAWSCDLLPSEGGGKHLQGDVFLFLDLGWDIIIAHPPCTFLVTSANKWMKPEYSHRFPDRLVQREVAVAFFIALYNSSAPMVCVENPVGIMSTRLRKPDQVIQPYQFGHPETKATCLWLKGLPKLVPTNVVSPVTVAGKRHRFSPGMCLPRTPDRWKHRSRTFQGIADAMAEQWSGLWGRRD